jgi:pimeloyl-ACP methyl ester carboxylesterase
MSLDRRAFVLAAAAAACTPAAQPEPPPAGPPTRFTVTVAGEGPDLILVHGLGSAPAVWDRVVAEFATQRRIHVLRLAGFAGAPAGANATAPILDGVADEIAGYIGAQKLQKPALIGHSMGGVIGLETAIRHRDALGRLMVIDALPFFSVLLNPAINRTEAAMQADSARDGMLRQTPAEFEASQRAAIGRLVTGAVDQARAIDWALSADRMVMAAAMHEVMTTDLRLEVARIITPTTVVCAHDQIMPFPAPVVAQTYAFNYAALRGVSVRLVEAARHYVMLDQPERFAGEVRVFLA